MNENVLNVSLKKTILNDAPSPCLPIAHEVNKFYGEIGNPFLAPRGVFIYKNQLIVSDTAQNRVFIWNQLPNSTNQKPDIVLGQLKSNETSRNAGGEVNAGSLMYPSGIWTNGTILIIADAWNHRVLIWNNFPSYSGQLADVVIGQKDFNSNLPNVAGINSAPNSRSLNWPYGVYSDGIRLYIADTGNRRVLIYNIIPTENFAKADKVIGKNNFDIRDIDSQDAIWPYSVKVNKMGKIAITDTQYYRVLLWHTMDDAMKQKSNLILGQPDLDANGQNQFLMNPYENTLSWNYDTCFYKDGIFVADTGNSRILWFNTFPTVSNMVAASLIGKNDFYTGSENADTLQGTDKSLYWPFSISIEEESQTMVVADTGNHRIVFYKLLI